jgi:[NiFe] hydrogenase diaphorase moiety large subunit
MSKELEASISRICAGYGNDRTRMMDIVRAVQAEHGCVSSQAMDLIASRVSSHRVEVESVVSFYAFLSSRPKGRVVIRLCDDIIDQMQGYEEVAAAFRKELGIDFGGTTPDGLFTLEHTPCVGMSDQAPAALVNDEVFTSLSPDAVRKLVAELRKNPDPSKLAHRYGDGSNASELVHSMVSNNIRQKGEVIFAEMTPGAALRKTVAMSPAEVIREVKTARLRGRGGAGFPTGMKWEFTRKAAGEKRYVLCNADEGEPGTFKDRVLLTECAGLLFEGMAVAGYAIGADTGILYLRAEYAYLRRHLEKTLEERRKAGLLGRSICGKAGFDFDVRIQMGAGAYVCGEETALISSCEGLRGDPKNRPPFPAEKGFLAAPTAVNNVETLCAAARVMACGAGWFAQRGSQGSPGTKLLSVSGDCTRPGVYEVPFGMIMADFLKLCGAEDAAAVQVGGPSGQMIGPAEFGRKICYDDLATGGSIMVFNASRDVLAIARAFNEFFCEESCGYCTPCRAGNQLLRERLAKIAAGQGEPEDLDYLTGLCRTMKVASRCGLGQTAGNPVATSIKNFRATYEKRLKKAAGGMQPDFDLAAAVSVAAGIAGRPSAHAD